jgi:hypothetical protein
MDGNDTIDLKSISSNSSPPQDDGQAMIEDLNIGTSANYGGEDESNDNPLTNFTTGGVQDSAGPGFGGNTGATAVDLDRRLDKLLKKNTEDTEDNEFY